MKQREIQDGVVGCEMRAGTTPAASEYRFWDRVNSRRWQLRFGILSSALGTWHLVAILAAAYGAEGIPKVILDTTMVDEKWLMFQC